MRKLLYASMLLLLLSKGVLEAERVQDLPRPANYVNDFAGVLSPAVQARLNALCADLDQKAQAQIAVITVKSLDGEPIENFATELEEKWKVGAKGSDRGLLLILAINDRQRRIEVGYGLEGILPDARVGDIGRQMVPYLRQSNYDQAVSLAVGEMAQIIAADRGVSLSTSAPRGPPVQAHNLTFGQLIGGIVFILVILFVLSRLGGGSFLGFLLGMFLGGGGRRGGGDGWGGGDGGGDGGGFGGFGGGSSGGGGASGDW